MSSSEIITKPSLKPPLESTPILSLPDDLLVSCLARVPVMYHLTSTSLVCKRFQSLLTSPELFEARSLLGLTETCLFVCFRFSPDNKPRWFTLFPNSTGYVFAPVPTLNFPQSPCEEQVVVVDSAIYAIGGPINDAPSSTVSVLDRGSRTWREAPSMKMERFFAAANVFDGKIYVAGGCESEDCDDSSNWMEVFDPKTKTWEFVSSPLADRCGIRIRKSVVIDGEIIMFGYKGVTFKPKEDKWEEMGSTHYLNLGGIMMSCCVIDNVVYRFQRSERIVWYDSEKRYWKDVKGLESLPKFDIYALARLVDFGGKVVVLWEKPLPCSGDKVLKVICCAVISLERRMSRINEIWGNVEWLDGLLTVPASCGFSCAVAAEF
ncbi:hypothetical protein EUTSA_v10002574mg [Eutrema salsugineum]|uniref:F-box domain-containing protein n=1 Tax=Eutrema salsugineum TaxID=72664 RepID=V4KHP0_EUTSA|nr:F-box/kelch-repeat protein At5g49000 [Eutrema salsugineum]ESQ37360.1 hypothetical protein EUTSA_v10002574mg [Eutrema salsugineum]